MLVTFEKLFVEFLESVSLDQEPISLIVGQKPNNMCDWLRAEEMEMAKLLQIIRQRILNAHSMPTHCASGMVQEIIELSERNYYKQFPQHVRKMNGQEEITELRQMKSSSKNHFGALAIESTASSHRIFLGISHLSTRICLRSYSFFRFLNELKTVSKGKLLTQTAQKNHINAHRFYVISVHGYKDSAVNMTKRNVF